MSGWSWVEIGELIGAGSKSIYCWLSGSSDPRNDVVEALERMIGEYSAASRAATTEKQTGVW